MDHFKSKGILYGILKGRHFSKDNLVDNGIAAVARASYWCFSSWSPPVVPQLQPVGMSRIPSAQSIPPGLIHLLEQALLSLPLHALKMLSRNILTKALELRSMPWITNGVLSVGTRVLHQLSKQADDLRRMYRISVMSLLKPSAKTLPAPSLRRTRSI